MFRCTDCEKIVENIENHSGIDCIAECKRVIENQDKTIRGMSSRIQLLVKGIDEEQKKKSSSTVN